MTRHVFPLATALLVGPSLAAVPEQTAALAQESRAATGAGPFELTVDSIMGGPDRVGTRRRLSDGRPVDGTRGVGASCL